MSRETPRAQMLIGFAGVVALGLGAGLLAAHWTLLAVGRVPPARALLLVGFPVLAIGVMVSRRYLPGLLAATGVLALSATAAYAGAYALSKPAVPIDGMPLETVALPGFDLALPAGEVGSAHSAYVVGTREIRDPGGAKGLIEVRWINLPPLGASELEREARVLASPAELVRQLEVDLGPNPVFAGLFEHDRAAGVTFAYCRDAGQLVTVATGLLGSPDQIAALHRRISQSIACGPGVPADQREPLAPRFDLPGVTLVPDRQPATFVGQDRIAYVFHPAVGDASTLFHDRPELLAEMLEAMGAAVADREPELRAHQGRQYASVVLGEGESATRITVGAFYCPDLGLSFIGQHQAPDAVALERAVTELGRARCPEVPNP